LTVKPEALWMAKAEEVPDEVWAVLKPLIPKVRKRRDGRGRPQQHSDRAVLNGILWVLRTGAGWADLPERFPSGSTCYRRFSRWAKNGTLRRILEYLARHLEEVGRIDLSECFIDGTFVVAKKGGPKWERPSGAKVQSSWLLRTLQVFHSPCTRLLLHHMKSPLSKLPSLKLSPWDDPEDLSGIVPMTAIRWIKGSKPKASNSLRRTNAIAVNHLRRMAENYAAINDAGKSNASLLGSTNSNAS